MPIDVIATHQFKQVKTPSGKKAFEAYVAVWTNNGSNVAICAPTIEKLAEVWPQFTGTELAPEYAQHVFIVKVEKEK